MENCERQCKSDLNVSANNFGLKEFYDFISDDVEVISPLNQFLKRVPKIHQSYIRWIVAKQFNNDVDLYKKSIPLFTQYFSIENKLFCDESFIGESKNRRLNAKKRKALILYSAQLLQLVGKNRSSILSEGMVNFYRDEMEVQENFVFKHKLISSNGKVIKLTSPDKRQKIKLAQNYRISKTLEKIAVDRKFTFSFVTLTLPGSFHCNPTKGRNSYGGKTPEQAKAKLSSYWQLIRANLAKQGIKVGADVFGVQVMEGHEDSSLHTHCLIYHSAENTELIHEIIKGVAKREADTLGEKLKFDIRLNDGRAGGATYIFKYISKALANHKQNDNFIKNSALRFFYSSKAFSFFGVQNKLNLFNFLVVNYKPYEKIFDNDDIVEMLEKKDLYKFLTKYHQFFSNVKTAGEKGKSIFLGVSYKPLMTLKKTMALSVNEVLIEKKQYSIFESVEIEDKENFTFVKADNSIISKPLITKAFDYVVKKQNSFDIEKLKYFKEQLVKGFNNFVKEDNSSMIGYAFLGLVTLNQHYSSAVSAKPFELPNTREILHQFTELIE